jgi:hypothetical protein
MKPMMVFMGSKESVARSEGVYARESVQVYVRECETIRVSANIEEVFSSELQKWKGYSSA